MVIRVWRMPAIRNTNLSTNITGFIYSPRRVGGWYLNNNLHDIRITVINPLLFAAYESTNIYVIIFFYINYNDSNKNDKYILLYLQLVIYCCLWMPWQRLEPQTLLLLVKHSTTELSCHPVFAAYVHLTYTTKQFCMRWLWFIWHLANHSFFFDFTALTFRKLIILQIWKLNCIGGHILCRNILLLSLLQTRRMTKRFINNINSFTG